MGGSRSSSKRKSSRRKASKISETRRKKRNRRAKSRKLRSSDDSSYSDDSSSSVSPSCSTSEDEYRRARSRARNEVKGRKKRNRSTSRSGSREDSRRVKKSKSSKRSSRKKSQKKKRRREPSVTSINSDSRSCSTCRDGRSSSEESELGKRRGRSRGKSKKDRNSNKAKSRIKHNEVNSRSCSSCSRSSDGNAPRYKDIPQVDSGSRRLRSVITIPKSQESEENELDRDGNKEEILYDHDDYPSSRSNDSIDEGSKRELAYHSWVDSERTRNAKGGEALVSDFKQSELTKSGVDGDGKDHLSNSLPDEVGLTNSNKEIRNQVFPLSSSSNAEDLESMLRLKALENLKKFRGGLQKNPKAPAEKNKNDSDVKLLSTAKDEFVENKTPKDDSAGVIVQNELLDLNPTWTMRTDSAHQATSHGNVEEEKGSFSKSGSATHSVIEANQVATSSYFKEKLSTGGDVANKLELGKSSPKQELLSTNSILEQPHVEKVLGKESEVDKGLAETSRTVCKTSNNNDMDINNVKSSEPSILKPASGEKSSIERQGEDKEGSQFEQKTMSVMRGGEMVQVSYKVYIPKKAPALARRQLRR
ncbi:hypothetical protein NMG60_11037045 [Bertholletia excelsa]